MTSAIRHQLLHEMIRIRTVEETLADLYRDEQEMRTPTHFSIGQEATAAGVCAATRPEDIVYSGHRSHAPYLAKGGDLGGMVAELYGKRAGCAGGRGGSVHLVDLDAGFGGAAAILAEMISVAVGAAWAFAMKSEPRVALTFFGDGATEEGAFSEAVNFAMVRRLPVVFVCENNLYSIASPLKARQPEGTTIRQRGNGYGMRSERLDGNDVFAVYQGAREAVEWCRTGNGPFLLELLTYRWRQHVGPDWDHDTGYRSKSEVDSWIDRCPIARAIQELRVEDPEIEAKADRWRTEFRVEVGKAVADAKAEAFPAVEDLFEGAYEAALNGRGERR